MPDKDGNPITPTTSDGRVLVEHPCEECGDDTLNEHLCRDCSIDRDLTRMECSACHKMRYRTDDEFARSLGGWLWGDPCVCDQATVPACDWPRASRSC